MFLNTSCEKEETSEPKPEEEIVIENNEKKGTAFTLGNMNWSKRVARLKPYWHYSWGSELNENEPENVEFIPMIWGNFSVDAKVAELKELATLGQIEYLLGFNEPDGADQANMTVDKAIELWPKLEEVGVPLGSPATVNPLNDWMKEFMSKAESQGLRVDFVCVHSYGGLNFPALKEKLEQVYAEYGKPIWITEFAVADWEASTPEENKYTPNQVLSYMKQALPALDAMDIVERYAWFPSHVSHRALSPSALFDENENLTQLGIYYANYKSNENAGPGKEPVIYPNIEGNLIPNGNFGDYHIYGAPDDNASESVGWFGYQITVEPGDAVENYSGKMKNDWSGNSAMSNIFPVEGGKTYAISFYVKWLGNKGSIAMSLKDDDAIVAWEAAGKPADSNPPVLIWSPSVIADESGNNSWSKVDFEYTVPEGTSNLRLTFWKPDGSSVCLIDEVFASEKL